MSRHLSIFPSYARFIVDNWRLLGFAFALSFGSSFGQTFYISLSSADIRAEFGLSHGTFGTVFMIATLASAACLIWAGRQIDHVDLRLFAGIVVGVLVVAMVALSFVHSVVLLTLVLFLLRFCGQGLMIHTASTTMARYFDRDRGKALSIGMLGQPVGEAVLPAVAVALIVLAGWRDAWLLTAGAMAAASAVLLPWLLRGHADRHREFLVRTTGTVTAGAGSAAARRSWTRGEVLRDPRFYLVCTVIVGFPFIGTGLFFHQVHIANTRGWPLGLLAEAFVVFAAARVAVSLVIGPVIDRFGAVRLIALPLFPVAVALLAIILSDSPVVPFIYLGALGVSIGTLIPLLGAFWTEMYGALHIGAIKALSTSVVVLGSALSPAAFGLALDAGVTITAICWVCFIYVILAGVAVTAGLRARNG